MADGEGSSSALTPNQEELARVAQNEIAQAMNKAVANVSNNSKEDEQSEFPMQQLSYSTQMVPLEENVEYVEPMQDPYNKAIKYLENHNILQLFQVILIVFI